MKILQQTIASLGSPMWIEPLELADGSAAVIARWRHLNGRLRISTADAIRVCLSLSTGQEVRHAERDRSLSRSVLAGDVIVLRPGIPTETTLEGDAEIVQIFVEPESLGQAMLDVGLPENVAEDNANAVGLMADGDCDYVTDDVATILGRVPRSFEQFATDYAAAFSPQLVKR
jgi:hypothetical protein